jgi:aldose 1-epimerase
VYACNKQPDLPLLKVEDFTDTIDSKAVSLYTLNSGQGIVMQVTNFGCRVLSLWTPDKNGKYEDIVLGHKTLQEYIDHQGERFIGPVVGRYANRIAGGKFSIDSLTYTLPLNDNGQSLHGGLKGFDMAVWDVDSVSDNQIRFSYISPDGEEGYPGNLTTTVTYTLTPANEFKVEYTAKTDATTIVNLSFHGLFNLKGEGNGTILDHLLFIDADSITPIDSVLIPSGELDSVENTPFDFRKPTAIGDRINNENNQLRNGKGYDHNWVFNRKTDGVELLASLYEPVSGRLMEILTDQPGMQFYSGNFFTGKIAGKYGKTFNYRESLALETQKFPDSPNHVNFPSTRLNPGEIYTQTCIYKFSAK